MFGGHTLDLTRGSLRSGDRTIELRPKSFGVLVYLVQNAGRLVSKDELIQAVWPDVAVSDDSLAKCVSEVRAALRDGDQRLVKTVPRRGYVLDVPVSPVDGASGLRVPVSAAVVDLPAAAGVATADARPLARPAPPWWRAHARLAALVLAASTAAVVLSLGWGHLIAPPAPDRASIAVLPFSKGHTPEYDYFTDGLTEDLITSLGRFRELLVIARDSTFVYKGRQVAPQEIGRELG
ncbi:MAG TPA: winged helix-turn-helix domain-containing protein, partial [Methylomirabilota bacterium]